MSACLHLLRTLPPAGSGPPQLLHCSFFSPHPPFDTNATYLERVAAGRVVVPPLPDPAAMHPADSFASIQKRHLDYSVELPSGGTRHVGVRYSHAQTALVRRVYYAMGSEVDEWIGRLLAALATRSDRQAWYTIYLSDHGENQMEHRQTGAPML